MESFSGMLMMVGWFLLRFGAPLLITISICWVLQKLDNRWKKDSERVQESVSISKLTTIMKCWLHHECPKKQRMACLAYQDPDKPCWQHFRKADGHLQNRCIGCAVFRSTPAPSFGD